MGDLKKTDEAANFLELEPSTLETWRSLGKGPKYIKISRRCVRYDPVDLEAFLDSKRKNPENDDA
jgi:hypothetical protein